MGKLMKYELRSMLKLFIPLWLGVLALAVVNRFTTYWELSNSRLLNTLMLIAIVLYGLAVAGIVIFAVIYVILRFYQGLMKDEGYLTFTLPVSIDSILWGKAFSALIVILVSSVVSILSLLLMLQAVNWSGFRASLRQAAEVLGGGNMTLIFVLAILLIVMSTIVSIFQLYLAMGIGQMAQKHRVGASILAYVGINVALNIVTSLAVTPWIESLINHAEFLWNIKTVGDVMRVVWTVFAIFAAACLILMALYYFITRCIFSKHLNLE